MNDGVKELNLSISKLYELYLYQLNIPAELIFIAQKQIEERKNKILPSHEDLHPNTRFVDNDVFRILINSRKLKDLSKQYKVSWNGQYELLKTVWNKIESSELYTNYMHSAEFGFAKQREFAIELYKTILGEEELLYAFYEERSIYWLDDFELVNAMVLRSIKSIDEDAYDIKLMDLFNDKDEDKQFMLDLFTKAILFDEEYEDIVQKYTKNWDVERIAMIDIIIMKMGICEALNFRSIPIKVTLNEYIDLSKRYSTPKSRIFVNGMLDKIFSDLKKNNKIVKTGRGLLE
jgi:N utilization substance protein B